MISVALLSKWHVHAVDYARQANQNPDIMISMVWDEIQERGQAWAKELGVKFEPDLAKVLSDPLIDAVIVDAPTNMHKQIILEAAKNGKHVFTEKVLALTVADCFDIFQQVTKSQVHLMVSLPRLVDSYYLYAQDALDRGLLGKLTSIRCRCSHNGAVPSEGRPTGWIPKHFYDREQCGGGSLIDLGAHPIYLTNRLAGPAIAVTARLSSYLNHPVDDNSAVLVEYESGALGVLETGFVSDKTFLLELYGMEGSLIVEEKKVKIKSRHFVEEDWIIPNLPPKLSSPMEQWLSAISDGSSPTIVFEDMWRLTQINQAAFMSNLTESRLDLKLFDFPK